MGWFAAALTTAVPLAFDPAGYFIFLPLKWTLATSLLALAVAALILERRSVPLSPAVIGWGPLLAVIVLSAVAGIGGITSWIGYPGRYLGVVAWIVFFGAFAVGAALTDGEVRRRVVVAAAATSIVVSIYALFQEIGVDAIDWAENIDESRTRSTLGNAAFLGAYLAMIVPLTGRLALQSGERPGARAVFGGAAVLGAVALLTSETRGAWIGAVAGIVTVLALDHRRIRALPRRVIATAGVGVLVAVVLLATVSPWADRVRSITDPTAATGRGRLAQWEETVDLVADRPVLGWGPDTYAFAFPRYIDAEFEQKVGRDVVPDRAHNLFLDLGATVGVLGLLAFLAVGLLVVRAVARAGSRDALTVGLAGAVVAYVAQLQFSFPLVDLDVIFWLFAGLLVATTPVVTVAVDRRWAAVPLAVAIVSGGWGLGDVWADRTLRDAFEAEAAGDLFRAQRLVDRSADRAPGRAQYLEAAARLHRRVGEVSRRPEAFVRGLERLHDAQDLMPRDLELALDRADLLLAWGETTGDAELIADAAQQYEEVLAVDAASSRAHLRLGVAYVQIGQVDDAEDEWLAAASLAPRSAAPLVNLGLLYEQEGRDGDARSVLRRALDLDPSNPMAEAALARLEQ